MKSDRATPRPESADHPGPARPWTRPSPRGYRRKWKPTSPEARRTAAASLTDVFRRRKARGFLWVLLLASLSVHAVLTPYLAARRTAGLEELASEDSYLRKVLQKERARRVAKEIQNRITMPPPPPEPEALVERAMTEALTSDIEKVTAGVLPMQLQAELASYVKTNLKDELTEAAKNIAAGALSEEEIEQLHRKFQKKAHEMSVAWRKEYLEAHQIERATMSTTEWYEKEVSTTLFGNMHYELFRAYHKLWYIHFGRRAPTTHWGRWGFLGLRGYGRKLAQLQRLLPADEKAPPEPGAEHAAELLEQLGQIRGRQIFDGRFTQWYSWETAYDGYIADYYPHRAEAMHSRYDDKLAALWDEALTAAEAYAQEAQGASADGDLRAAQAACFRTVRQLVQTAGELIVQNGKDYEIVNQAVRSRVLRGPAREKLYEYWVTELVNGLAPLVRDFAKGQFKKGILVHKDGVEEAIKEFPSTVIPLLRRDVMRMLPKKVFDRIVFKMDYANPYVSKVTGEDSPPDAEDIRKDEQALARVLETWPADEKQYVQARAEVIAAQFRDAIDRVKETILQRVLTGNLLFRRMDVFVEGVDYSDKVQERLNARAMALKGRGQDLAKLTPEGVPDTSAPLVALIFGASKGHGANLEPVATEMRPAMVTLLNPPAAALRSVRPRLPRAPTKWGLQEQPTVECTFQNSPRFEAIPFLTKFPRLDGNINDWGEVRPLMLKSLRKNNILVYAAWNYQGFFFGYRVRQKAERFYYPSVWRQAFNHNTGGVWYGKVKGVDWAFQGDYMRLVFDTLDARNANRGEPHTQEFVIFPMGIESDPNVPGIERVIVSQRDAITKEYRGVKASCRMFAPQPPAESGPDGSGPFRVTQFAEDGYTTEVFIPRSLLNVPVFAPGWHLGFDCAVAMGVQARGRFRGQVWATGDADRPDQWGDLLLLGTDPQIVVQEANATGNVVYDLIPGHSVLLTVVDPDRNVNPAAEDSLLVSAEVADGTAAPSSNAAESEPANDVEVFVLKETEKNSGVFRGYVNTQPGFGRQVQGILEIMPLQRVRFGYVDFADSKGKRNVVNEMILPVIAPMMHVARGSDVQTESASK